MTTLYSSTFISIVFAFLMFLGYNNQSIDVVENPNPVNFSNILGEENPFEKIRIEIFDDLICENCSDFMLNTLVKIRSLEKETDEIDLRLYFIPNVNDELFTDAAMSLKCAADQGQFWPMHTKFHEHKENLSKKSFIQFGKELELNVDALNECMKEEAHQKDIEEDIQYASENNIIFKPTTLINGYKLIGNQPFENIQKVINEILKGRQPRQIINSELFEQTTDLEQELRSSGAFDL